MKKEILVIFMKRGKNIRILSCLFLCIILSLKLSGQSIQTMVSDTWTGGVWQKALQQTFTYDGSGHLLNMLSQTWDVPTLSWKNSTQSNYTNNPDGTANVVISQTWDGVSAWNNSSRTTYTYNASKKVLTSVTELWLIAIWQNSLKQTNAYDGSGFLTNNLTQTWDLISSSWKNSTQINYTNNSDGNATQAITQLWDGVSAWTNSHRSTLTYNPSKKVLTDVSDDWDSGIWKANSRETNTYDGSGYLTNALSQLWDAGSTSWKNNTQSNYTNNVNGSASVVISQTWDGISTWNNTSRITFTYSSPTYNPELIGEESFTIYPNPAVDFIKIEASKNIEGLAYSITDQTGKMVLKGKIINESATIDISTLTNGIYFIHIGERNQHSYKIIKKQAK